MNTYIRIETVEATETEDGTHMLVFPTSPEISKDGLITIPSPYLIPVELFHQNYSIVPPDKESVMNDQIADYLREPLVGFDLSTAVAAGGGFASSEPDDAQVFAAGRPIIDLIIHRIPDTISNFSGFITLETLLWGAEVAFNFGISKLPFPVPEPVKRQLWDLLEQTIRSIWAEKNPAPV